MRRDPVAAEPIATETRVSTQANGELIRKGADLVYLAESFYVGFSCSPPA